MRGLGRHGFRAAAFAVCGLVAWVAVPAGAEDVRRVEAVGAVPVGQGAPEIADPREAALRRGVADAVLRVAVEHLPSLDPEAAGKAARRSLGRDPFAYANRFRVVEDRGERAALFGAESGAEAEYVVVVEVEVDVARVRARLQESGLVKSRGGSRRLPVQLRATGLEDHAAYAALLRILVEELGARSAVPAELIAGEALLVVDADRSSEALVAALTGFRDPELRAFQAPSGDGTPTIRVEYRAARGRTNAPARAGFGDRSGRN